MEHPMNNDEVPHVSKNFVSSRVTILPKASTSKKIGLGSNICTMVLDTDPIAWQTRRVSARDELWQGLRDASASILMRALFLTLPSPRYSGGSSSVCTTALGSGKV
jgi:hypothetical protein